MCFSCKKTAGSETKEDWKTKRNKSVLAQSTDDETSLSALILSDQSAVFQL